MKTVLITGSTHGIGLAIAIEFAKTRLYNIVFNGVHQHGEAAAESVAKEYGVKTMFIHADMLVPAELKSMVTAAIEKFGSIDVLVNNAGVQHVSPIEDFLDEHWIEIIGVNLSAAFYLTKAVWPGMKQQQFGRIINIASAHGLVASPYKSAYVSSKHGLVGFTKTIALEGAPYGITANAICPGYVRTALVEHQISSQAIANQISEEQVISQVLLARQPIKEFIPAELIGQMAVLLASESSATLTGTAIPIDGGWNAQ